MVGVPAISAISDTSEGGGGDKTKPMAIEMNKRRGRTLTPSHDGVPVKVASLGKEGLHQQGEEVQALDEEPEIVGHDAVVKENHHRFARHLHGQTETGLGGGARGHMTRFPLNRNDRGPNRHGGVTHF